MQDKLESLLKIKIDAINRNIENLNYLNNELEKNDESLEYIAGKIKLFESDNILNFDKIDKSDFDRILLLINSKVSDIFQDKSCNYQGIMYILQGIRQGISLSLTANQKNAILSFQEGMLEYESKLKEKINDLIGSKERLPEIDLDVLSEDLGKYKDISNKLTENKYLVEIDDIVDVLDFSNIHSEEKALIFEYILKYNANIYSKENILKKEEPVIKFEEVGVPEFHYEPINISEITSENSREKEVINLNDFGTLQMPIVDEDYVPEYLKIEEPEKEEYNINEILERLDEKVKLLEQEQEKSKVKEEIKEEIKEDNSILNTVDLEDIIKQIDAKLSEIEKEESDEKFSNVETFSSPSTPGELNTTIKFPNNDELNFFNRGHVANTVNLPVETELEEVFVEDKVNNVALKEVLKKYNLSDNLLDLINQSKMTINVFEIDSILTLLKENNLLEVLKEDVLVYILTNTNKNKLNELFMLIKDNLVSKNDTLEIIIKIIAKTMPILIGKTSMLDTLKENIEFFKSHQINIINLFDNYRELLIVENNLLKANYEKITKYNLALNDDNVKYLLYNNNVLENIDYYIEAMGAEKGFLGANNEFDGIEYITKNPYKLNIINANTLMKLRYSTENDMKIYGSKPGILAGEIANPKVDLLVMPDEYKNLYFNLEYSFMDRSELLNLLEELKVTNSFDLTLDVYLAKLDSLYKLDDLKYKIENVIFSRIKTIRLYNFLKTKGIDFKNALIIALTYNSVIKKEEYLKIENIINMLIKGGN